MNTLLSPTDTPPGLPAMDFDFLRQEGIRHIEQMAKAGMLWTDFNTHDPGITILEQLCYAITDLAYRIDYPIPDLLASDNAGANAGFFSPAQIMTTHPVTLDDLRKLVLDVRGIKNAWIEKVDTPDIPLHYHAGSQELRLKNGSIDLEPVRLKGLYRVLIETSELANIDGALVKKAVFRRLHAFRPLCEDFEAIKLLPKQKVQINARIEIGPVDDVETLLATIYEKISGYFSPRIDFASLDEMLGRGVAADRIFEGPHLEHGFVDSQALHRSKRRTAIHVSDLIHALMDVDGVRAVRDILVVAGTQKDDWSVKMPEDRVPVLDLDHSQIVLEKDRLMASVDRAKARKKYFDRLIHAERLEPLKPEQRDFPVPAGRHRNIAAYHSIQQQFPACFGIGQMGLPASATAQRRGQARQLKAFLTFFDQVLANYFSQLAHVKDLFCFNGAGTGTYFTQAVKDNGLGLDEITIADEQSTGQKIQSIMDELVGDSANSDRKNRFLNHLLARFAEQFTDYALFLFEVMPRGIDPVEKMIRDKQAFLRQYPAVSGRRGTAFNYLQPWSSQNLSGLEKRIRLKLGLMESKGEVFYIVEHILLRPMKEDIQQEIAFLIQAQTRDPYSLQLSFIFPQDWNERLPKPDDAGMTESERLAAEEAFNAQKSRFRRFVEQTVREETPAHLIPYIHWLSKEAMAEFETFYKSWVEKRRSFWTT